MRRRSLSNWRRPRPEDGNGACAGSALAKPMSGELVSGNYFATLGLAHTMDASHGRDDTPAAPPWWCSTIRRGRANSHPTRRSSVRLFTSSPDLSPIGIARPASSRPGHRFPAEFWVPINTEPYSMATVPSSITRSRTGSIRSAEFARHRHRALQAKLPLRFGSGLQRLGFSPAAALPHAFKTARGPLTAGGGIQTCSRRLARD